MRKYIDIFASAIWFILLVALMIRMPVAKILVDTRAQFSACDIALSGAFCAIGLICPVLGYAFSRRQLFVISVVNAAFFAAMIIFFAIAISSANTALFTLACYFVNLFCAILSFKGNLAASCVIFLTLQMAFIVLFSVLLKIKKEK